jgi:elongin-A
MQDDRELWMEFIKRDIPGWEQYDLPKESDCWYDIYCNLLEQLQREVEEGALQLKQAVDKFYSEKASNAAVLVNDTSRLPKPRRRFQPSVRTTEPKKKGLFSTKRNRVLAVPTHQLNTGASRINHVPQWLVDEHKQVPSSTTPRKQPDTTTSPKSAPSSSSTLPVTSGKVALSRNSTTRPRIGQSTTQSTPVKKKQIPPGSRPVLPMKRPSDGSLSRIQAEYSDLKEGPPARPSASAPPAKPLIRKRPTMSQPNVFIQQKKRRT